jgi:ABC-type transport system involved in multi-copper enzyme maturation permease subunit
MTGLIRGELLKIRTTNTWWLFGLGVIGTTALALLVNCLQADFFLNQERPDTSGMNAEDAANALQQYESQSQVIAQAANIFTSGQFFGGLFVLMLGMLIVTNEFYHQTATATFLTTPHRSSVMAAKLVTGVAFAAVFWLVTTIMSLPTGLLFFQAQEVSNGLGEWEVQRAIIFNLLVFILWGIVGVGFGALIRNQIGAVLTGSLLYVIGTQAATIIFFLIHEYLIKEDWVLKAQVIVPAVAAQVFVSATEAFPDAPEYWVGGIVMLAYGVLCGLVGTLILRKRDIS